MFQDTRQSQRQDQGQQQLESQVKTTTDETQRRAESEAQLRAYDAQRQAIDGTVRDVQGVQRDAISKQQVTDKAQERVMPGVDEALSKLQPPSFNQDTRGQFRDEIRKAIAERAHAVDEQKDEQDKTELETGKKLARHERLEREALFAERTARDATRL